MHQLHALRRPGRARGVDQRQHVGRLDLRDRRVDVEARGSSPRRPTAPASPAAPRRRRRSRARGSGAACAPRAPAAGTAARRSGPSRRRRRRGTGSARPCRCCRSRTASRRASSPRGRRGETRDGCSSISATLSPRCTPSLARPPASASTRSRSSPQVIVNASSLVRIATCPARSAAVMRNASAIVAAPRAARAGVTDSVSCSLHCTLPPLAVRPIPMGVCTVQAQRDASVDHTRSAE